MSINFKIPGIDFTGILSFEKIKESNKKIFDTLVILEGKVGILFNLSYPQRAEIKKLIKRLENFF